MERLHPVLISGTNFQRRGLQPREAVAKLFSSCVKFSGNAPALAFSAMGRRKLPMVAIIYKFVRSLVFPSTHVSSLAVVTALALGGLDVALIMVRFGLDYGAGIQG